MADIKISDEQFLSILRDNAGLFANTAKAIENQLGITYSRQAVRQRALEHPDELADIEEMSLDIAENAMNALMKSDSEDIKFKSSQFVLKTKGKRRGYIERSELDIQIPTAIRIIRDKDL